MSGIYGNTAWKRKGTLVLPRNDGDWIRVPDSTGADFLDMYHDGTNSVISTNAGELQLTPTTNVAVTTGNVLVGDSISVAGIATEANFLAVDASGGRIGVSRYDNAVHSGNIVGEYNFYGGEGHHGSKVASIRCVADGAWTSTSSPTVLHFLTTPSGSINTTASEPAMSIYADNQTYIYGQTNVVSTSSSPFIIYRNADDTTGANFGNNKSRGTYDTPLDVVDGDNTGGVIANAYMNGAYRNCAGFRAYLSGATGTDSPGLWRWDTTAVGSTSLTQRMTLGNDGGLTLIDGDTVSTTAARLYMGNTATGISPAMVIQGGKVADAIGDGPAVYFKAANAPTNSLNRAKGMLTYTSTTTKGRGSFRFYQDSAVDADPVTTSDTLAFEITNNSDINIQSDKKIYLDGGTNTYIVYNSGTSKIEMYVGGVIQGEWG